MKILFKWGVIDCCILICFGWDEVKELGQKCCNNIYLVEIHGQSNSETPVEQK